MLTYSWCRYALINVAVTSLTLQAVWTGTVKPTKNVRTFTTIAEIRIQALVDVVATVGSTEATTAVTRRFVKSNQAWCAVFAEAVVAIAVVPDGSRRAVTCPCASGTAKSTCASI